MEEHRKEENFNGTADGSGGLWLTWIGNETRIIHFNSDGEIYEGWDEDGFMLWRQGAVNEITGYFAQIDSSIIILADKHTFDGPFGNLLPGSRAYFIQHVSEHPQQSVEGHNNCQPVRFGINSIYPNPFNSQVTISYDLSYKSTITLQIYNTRGQLVDVLLDRVMPAGRHSVVWDASIFSTGMYLVRMRNEGGRMKGIQKVVLVK